jgi:hypothetical protein
MKTIIGAFVFTLLLACLAVPGLVLAGAAETTASGSFKFALEDGETRFVEFKATEQIDGQTEGEMTFSDPVAIPVDNPDDPERPKSEGVLVRAKFDCMEITKNTAVIGGEIFDSNVPNAVGQRVLLVIEDNGVEGSKDRLMWGIFAPRATGWTPQDAERDDDKGAELTWTATDFERRDDTGIPAGIPNLSKFVACKSFPLTSFEFPEIKYGGGDLQVQP